MDKSNVMRRNLSQNAETGKSDSHYSEPNLLVIHTDQLSWWTIGAYGGTLIETPNIDRIAREGAVLTNFFTNSAVCTPSRGCFLTGRYPHAHGAYRNNISLNRDEITFARVLQEHGYDTGYAGKWHLDGKLRPGWVHEDRGMGFEDNYYMFNRGHWKKIEDGNMGDMQPIVYKYEVIGDEKTYTTDWLTDKTIEFVKRPRNKPFCYMVSFPDPHGPVWVRPPYDTMFHPGDMPLPSTLDNENVPSWVKNAQQSSPFGPGKPDREQRLRDFLALYCGEVKLIDDSVGRIITCLEQQDILDNTIIVFTADHGEYAGEHGLHGKNQIYETAHRIPMLIRWPREISQGTVIENVVSTVDFQPSILGLIGISPCGREQGRDASPLLRGEEAQWRSESFIHHSSLERAGIFTDEFELAYIKDAEPILFDRRNDPDQVRNLFGDPEYRKTLDELTQRIIQHNVSVESPAVGWLKQLDPASPRTRGSE